MAYAMSGIFWDSDGTLTGNSGESYLTASYPHLIDVDPNCNELSGSAYSIKVVVCING